MFHRQRRYAPTPDICGPHNENLARRNLFVRFGLLRRLVLQKRRLSLTLMNLSALTHGETANSHEAVQPRLLTKSEVAAYAQCTTRCIDNWMRHGYLPYFKIGRTVRFKGGDVDAYLSANFRVARATRSAF